jgi:hypothetical protein
MTQTKVTFSNICSAGASEAIGSRITNDDGFIPAAIKAIEAYDFAAARVPGQGFLQCPEAVPFVSAGVGPRSKDPKDYVLREHRGIVSAYLKREFAAPATGCALVVYTKEAYLKDPDVTADEATRVGDATHVIVALLAFSGTAGAGSPLSPYRFVWNLAGGNREAATWSADEIRTKAKSIIDYDNAWMTVAD